MENQIEQEHTRKDRDSSSEKDDKLFENLNTRFENLNTMNSEFEAVSCLNFMDSETSYL